MVKIGTQKENVSHSGDGNSVQGVKRILFINSSTVVYGAETRLLDMIDALNPLQFQSMVLLPAHGPLSEQLTSRGVKSFALDFRFQITQSNPLRFFRLTRDFMRIVVDNRIDLIHINLHYRASNFFLAFFLLRRPVIYHLRSHFWIHIFERWIMSHCQKIICVSKFVEKTLMQRRKSDWFTKFKTGQIEVIYDGISVTHFSKRPDTKTIRDRYHIAPDAKIVALVGSIMPVKGQDILIKAAKIILEHHPKTVFLISGGAVDAKVSRQAYSDTLIQLIKTLGLQEKIIWTGYVKDTAVFMNEIDILVQPSEREALGTSMVEAMACEKPVVGTNVDGIPEVIGADEAGFLLPQRTPEELAKAIIRFLDQPDLAKEKGMAGRQRVERKFDIKKNIRVIEKIYLECLKDGGSRADT